jgi:tetratricopeptide (TPR) repeat protein
VKENIMILGREEAYMRNIILIVAIVLNMTAFALAAQAEQGQPEQLKQLIADLQKNPDDYALREKIIKHVQTMEPRPQVPQEAKRPFIKGVTFQKEATSVSDYELAIGAYKEALLMAPWWPEALYNMALAQEGASKFDDAMQSLKLYLLTKPKDAQEAESKLYAMEAKKEKAAKNVKTKKMEGTRSSDGHYIDNGDGTITDTRTGLIWTKKDSRADLGECLNWDDSNRYVRNLRTGGYSDWRMPTVEELKTIYEKSKVSLPTEEYFKQFPISVDPIFISGEIWWWSSETTGSCCSRVVNFHSQSGGGLYIENDGSRGSFCNVRAVRR